MGEQPSLVIPQTIRVLRPDGVVDDMPLDEYLKGVVPAEMGLQKPLEALKAQAVAARTFAVVTRRHSQEGYDVCCTVHCQVFKPDKRYAGADRAVDETSGWIVTYGGRPAGTSFFAHCDGRTRNSEEVWTGATGYLRSVPCVCGYTTLYGHGVGMCQRGAAAMAGQHNATFRDILAHYYTGTELVRAQIVPRSSLRTSVVLGRVTNGLGQGRAGLRLVLSGPAGSIERGTTASGQFWFTGLPAGAWELSVAGRPVRYRDLFTDGRSYVELEVAVPDPGGANLVVSRVPGPRRLAGSIGYSGVPIAVSGPLGDETTVLSGSSAEFNPGGFDVALHAPGAYTLRFLDKSCDLDVSTAQEGFYVRLEAQP